MKFILFIPLTFLGIYTAFCQGTWNIGYKEIGLVDSTEFGKSIKIDFSHLIAENNSERLKSIRSFVTPEDTATIILEGREIRVKEKRRIYVDHGSFDDQYLEIIQDNNSLLIEKIFDSKLVEIKDDKFKFLITIETYEKKKERREMKIQSKTKEVWIQKGSLDGFLIKL
jgi:hypothetical protein